MDDDLYELYGDVPSSNEPQAVGQDQQQNNESNENESPVSSPPSIPPSSSSSPPPPSSSSSVASQLQQNSPSPASVPSSPLSLPEFEDPSRLFFEGSVSEAVSFARESELMLVVYIEGLEDENSRRMRSTFTDQRVQDALSEGSVNLRLVSTSQDARFFAQIYPILAIPYICFISPNGKLLHFLPSYSTPQQVVEGFQAAKAAQLNLSNPIAAPAAAAHLPAARKPLSLQMEPSSSTSSSSTPPPPSPSSSLSPMSPSSKSPSSTPDPAAEIKKKQLHEAIQRARQKKAEAEKQAEKELEKRRRNDGKELQKAVESIDDIKRKAELSKAQKEKKQDEEARKKILEQVKLDQEARRLEKEKRMAKPSAASSSSSSVPSAAVSSPSAPQFSSISSSEPAAQSETAAIAVRLTNGEVIKNTFSSRDTLAIVKSFIDRNRTDGRTAYQMLLSFPRRAFTHNDLASTLLELQLAPSATLIISPLADTPSGGRPGAHSTVMQQPAHEREGGSFLGKVKSAMSYLNPFAYFGGSSHDHGHSDDSNNKRKQSWQFEANPELERQVRAQQFQQQQQQQQQPSSGRPSAAAAATRPTAGGGGNIRGLSDLSGGRTAGGGAAPSGHPPGVGRPGGSNGYYNGNGSSFEGRDQ